MDDSRGLDTTADRLKAPGEVDPVPIRALAGEHAGEIERALGLQSKQRAMTSTQRLCSMQRPLMTNMFTDNMTPTIQIINSYVWSWLSYR